MCLTNRNTNWQYVGHGTADHRAPTALISCLPPLPQLDSVKRAPEEGTLWDTARTAASTCLLYLSFAGFILVHPVVSTSFDKNTTSLTSTKELTWVALHVQLSERILLFALDLSHSANQRDTSISRTLEVLLSDAQRAFRLRHDVLRVC